MTPIAKRRMTQCAILMTSARRAYEAALKYRRFKLDMANIASPSQAGSFDIYNPATTICRIFYFEISPRPQLYLDNLIKRQLMARASAKRFAAEGAGSCLGRVSCNN